MPRSLGYATDLMIAAFDGAVERGPDFHAVRTPSSPLFWWGNFMLFDAAPQAGQVADWEALFDAHVGRTPGVLHRNLAWDTTAGELGAAGEFLSAGYELNTSAVLTTSAPVHAPRHNTAAHVRPIATPAEWERVLAIQQASLPSQRESPSFCAFQEQQHVRDRRLVAAGHGQWFGAFVAPDEHGAFEPVLAASMGLFVQAGVGRCQSVATAPEFRRRGLCAALVHAVCRAGLEHMGAERIVIITTPGGAAERIYQSVGFTPIEHIASVSRTR